MVSVLSRSRVISGCQVFVTTSTRKSSKSKRKNPKTTWKSFCFYLKTVMWNVSGGYGTSVKLRGCSGPMKSTWLLSYKKLETDMTAVNMQHMFLQVSLTCIHCWRVINYMCLNQFGSNLLSGKLCLCLWSVSSSWVTLQSYRNWLNQNDFATPPNNNNNNNSVVEAACVSALWQAYVLPFWPSLSRTLWK